jgi:hypothetical protein
MGSAETGRGSLRELGRELRALTGDAQTKRRRRNKALAAVVFFGVLIPLVLVAPFAAGGFVGLWALGDLLFYAFPRLLRKAARNYGDASSLGSELAATDRRITEIRDTYENTGLASGLSLTTLDAVRGELTVCEHGGELSHAERAGPLTPA